MNIYRKIVIVNNFSCIKLISSTWLPFSSLNSTRHHCYSRCLHSNSSTTKVSKVFSTKSQLIKNPLQRNSATLPFHKSSLITRIKDSIGLTKLKYPKYKLSASGMRVFLCNAELVNYEDFFQNFNLPDTFNSWFRITELHMWLSLVRLASEGKEGQLMMKEAVYSLWVDVEKRSKKLVSGDIYSKRKNAIQDLSNQFRYALFSYDEGLLGDDRMLAAAVWRTFFERQDVDIRLIEELTAYIRKQIKYLDEQESDMILRLGILTFLPLKGYTEDTHRNKYIIKEIIKRS